MRIAVAVSGDFDKVAGHAGRARRWLIYDVAADGSYDPPERIETSSDEVFHYHEDGKQHFLDTVDALLAQSAGEGFLNRMRSRGVDAVMTGETDPARAVADYLAQSLAPAKPRPIGKLICKTVDIFSKHK